MLKCLNIKLQKYNGFTLIEILTAITIFTFLIMAALGVYMTSLTKHRQALRSQVVNEDLQYATEIMYRDIKESYIIALSADGTTIYLDHPTKKITDDNDNNNNGTGDCEDKGGNDCLYCDPSGDRFSCECCLQYHLNSTDNKIEVKTKDEPDCTFNSDCPALTSSRTHIESINFNILSRAEGTEGHEEDQPQITLLIRGWERDDALRTSEIFLQMTVTQKKVLNLYHGLY